MGSRSSGTTFGEALHATRTRLEPQGGSLAEAEELLTRLVGLRRTELYLDRERTLTGDQQQRLEDWVRRRLAGEPIQYITGRAAFRGLDLMVGSGVLIPRPETETLVEEVLRVLRAEESRWRRPRVLDLGTGSGAIALSIAAEWPSAAVTASDASAEALEMARRNAAALGLDARVTFIQADWFDAVAADDRFEVVISNPPYVAAGEREELPREVRDFEPNSALFSGPSGLEALREIADEAPRHLVAGGLLALELAEQRAEQVAGWLEGAHDWAEVQLIDDLTGRPRVVLARRSLGPAIAPAQWGEETPD